jgi:hypothetical protein
MDSGFRKDHHGNVNGRDNGFRSTARLALEQQRVTDRSCPRNYPIDQGARIFDPSSRQGERSLSVRLNMRLRDWAFGSFHGIRILELNRNLSVAIGKIHLLHHEAQIRFGFAYREVPALFTL